MNEVSIQFIQKTFGFCSNFRTKWKFSMIWIRLKRKWMLIKKSKTELNLIVSLEINWSKRKSIEQKPNSIEMIFSARYFRVDRVFSIYSHK